MLALEERQFRVEVGYGLEGILPDAKTGRIQDEYIIPYLKENNWNDGIKNGFNAFLEVIAEEYNVDMEGEPAIFTEYSTKNEGDSIISIERTIFVSSILGAILGFLKKKKIIKKNFIKIISVIYFIGLSVIYVIKFRGITVSNIESEFIGRVLAVVVMLGINLVCFALGMGLFLGKARFGYGSSSGGGSSGGGGSSSSF